MKKWLRRLRGAVGLELTWAAAWGSLGALIGLVFFAGGVNVELFANALLFTVSGFMGGVAFSGILGIAEGRRGFDEMSLLRFAGWGAVGGLLVSVFLLSSAGPLTPVGVLVTGVVMLMGAGSAAGSLALARRAEDGELLDAGEDVADIGMTEEETRELLGT